MDHSLTLLSPIKVGAWNLPNRIIMAPLTRCRASHGRVPNQMMAKYYAQRASAGLILSEATSVTPMGVGYPDTPGIWSDEQIDGWKAVTNAVHMAGGRIVLQLWHVGRISDPYYLNGAIPVAPSPIAASGFVSGINPKKPYVTPRALELGEIEGIIESYRKAAENAMRAGFDGVEVHGANGYLLEQFLFKSSNDRTDQFGGTIENRARLMLNVIDSVISVWGADKVGLHLSPRVDDGDSDGAESLASFAYVAEKMGERKIAFIFAREGKSNFYFGSELKGRFGATYIANQGLSFSDGEQMIIDGEADAIAWGRHYIANPDLVDRYSGARQLNEPDPTTFYGGGTKGYTDYPFLR